MGDFLEFFTRRTADGTAGSSVLERFDKGER